MYLDDREGAALCPTTEEQEEFVESCFNDREKLTNELIARNKTVHTYRFIPASALEHLGYCVSVELDRDNPRFSYHEAKEEYLDHFDPEELIIVFRKIDDDYLFKKGCIFCYVTSFF